jgi:hypothetical protein
MDFFRLPIDAKETTSLKIGSSARCQHAAAEPVVNITHFQCLSILVTLQVNTIAEQVISATKRRT